MFQYKTYIIAMVLLLCAFPIYAQNSSNGQGNDTLSLGTITVEAPRPDWESKLSPGTVTVIRPEEQKGEQKSLADMLKEVAGVHIREVNGKGHYTTVSIRGSTSSQVGIFIDGVLSNLGGDAAVDISTIPIKNVERIEIYRGYIPVRFGGTYIGGVINIVTKKPEKTDIQASLGKSSFGGYQGSIQLEKNLFGGAILVGFNHERSKGNFPYYSREAERQVRYANMNLDNFWTIVKTIPLTSWEAGGSFIIPNNFCGLPTTSIYIPDLCTARQNLNLNDTPDARVEFVKLWWETLRSENFYDWLFTQYGPGTDATLYSISSNLREYENQQELLRLAGDLTKWRKNNGYRNSDAIIKWQNDNLYLKFAWDYIDRYLPNPVNRWGGGGPDKFVDSDVTDYDFNLPRKQQITNKSFIAGYRNQISNLEWGISANYSTETKRYFYIYIPSYANNMPAIWRSPLRQWSRYESKRIAYQLDGEYKLGNRNLIEFLVNYSDEHLEIYGWDFRENSLGYSRPITYRPSYIQKLLNIQLQDTVTLDNNNSLFLTGSIKYNSSNIWSAPPDDPSRVPKENAPIKQIDDAFTWQVALKKTFGDNFALRATYGSYYRLLNLYEIAGDGAGILPQPDLETDGDTHILPRPEYGKQWEISAMYHTNALNSDTNITFTYFGRTTKRMLHLWQMAHGYYSYSNSKNAKTKGVELEASIAWDIFDIYMSGTLLDIKATNRMDCWGCIKRLESVNVPYTPEKEAYARINIRPFQNISFYSELKYTGEMVQQYWANNLNMVENLTTLGFGAKVSLPYGLELAVGVNDIFNKTPDQRILVKWEDSTYPPHNDMVMDYPNPGRTFYASLSFSY
jgi:vitamin B12 transporter